MEVLKSNKIRYSLIILTAMVAIAGVVYFLFFRPKSVEAEWYDETYFYRKKVEITNAGTAQTDFQVMITLDTATLYSAGKIQSDCDDIRITNITGKLLPHWLEPGTCNNASTKIWTKVPSIATTGATIYLYYGNPSATSVSSTTNTFIREISNVQGAWTMDEASWTNDCSTNTVTDYSNNANHGKSCPAGTGPLGGAAGKFGNGGSFDGDNDYVKVLDSVSLDITSAITIEMWIKANSWATTTLLSKKCDSSNDGYAFNWWGSYFGFEWADNGGVNNSANSDSLSLVTGTWYHIAVTANPTTVTFYKDGVPVGQRSKTVVLAANAGDIFIGKYPCGDIRFFNGLRDEIRIYNRALTSAEISDLYGTGGDRQGYVTTNYANKELVRKYSASVTVGSPGSEQQGPGPVAYWRFDEGYGDTTYDDSVNNNDGTRGGGTPDYKPTWQAEDMCVSGKCLRYDGTNDYVDAGDGNSLEMRTNDFAIEAWIKSNNITAGQSVVSKETTSGEDSTTRAYKVWIDTNGKISFFIADAHSGDSKTGSSNTVLSTNVWHHIAVSFDRDGDATFYKDGSSDGTVNISSANGDIYNTVNLTIGRRAFVDTPRWFNGTIDDVRIYNYARSAAQIKSDYLSRGASEGVSAKIGNESAWISNGLVGYWKMDEASWTNDCSTSTVTDSSGAGNNGKSCPAGTGPTGGAAGKFGNAGSFDGTEDNIQRTSTASLVLGTGDFSMGLWFKSAAQDATKALMAKPTYGVDGGWEFQLTSDGYLYWRAAGGVAIVSNTAGLDDNTWHHAYFVRSGATGYLYLNGIQDGTGAIGVNLNSDGTFYIGASSGGRYFNGTIDDVRIYNRALSPKEIRDLYNWAPGPVGYWKMDEKVSGNSQTLYDISTNANNGTTYWGGNASGMDCRVSGKYGTACQFDGTDDYVDAGNNASLQNLTTAMTMEAWVYRQGDGFGYIFQKMVGIGDDRFGFLWNFEPGLNGGLRAGWGVNAPIQYDYAVSTSAVPLNQWTHITVTREGTTAKHYINGILDDTDVFSGSSWNANTTTNLYISQGWDYFYGTIDDARIYNYARTQKQILEDMNAGHPAVGSPVGSYAAYWPFDEGYSNIAYDMSGNNNDGTLTPGAGGGNTQAYQMWDNNGKFNKAIEFDGTDDYIGLSSNSTASLSAVTIEGWVKITDLATARPIYNSNDINSDSNGINFRVYTTGRLALSVYGNVFGNRTDYLSNTLLSAAQWYHVVAVWTDSTSLVYINGIKDTASETVTGTRPTTTSTSNRNPTIGLNNWTTYWFNGLIDEVKIYPFALTEDEIRTEYNKGAAIKFGSVSTESSGTTASDAASRGYCVPGDATNCNGPVGEWKFDEKVSGNGQTVYDTSGSGNNGTTYWGGNASGMDCRVSGKYGTACQFDGTDDYVGSANNIGISGVQDRTIEFWAKPSTTNYGTIGHAVGWGSWNNFNWWSVTAYGNPATWQLYDGNALSNSGKAITTGWQHVVATFTGATTTLKIYVDGIQYGGDITLASTNTVNSIVVIGTNLRSPKTQFFNGLIDDVRIYNYARTPAQIAWDYNRGGPVGYWEFDECQGGTTYDLSDNNNDGTITIGATGTQDGIGTCTDGDTSNAWYNGRTGKYNSAMSFDGTDDYVQVADSTSLDITNGSVGFWIKPDVSVSIWSFQALVCKGGSGGVSSDWAIYYNRNDGKVFVTYQSTQSNSAPTVLAQDGSTWYHVVAVQDGGTLKIYINGKLDLTQTFSWLAANNLSLSIGADNQGISRYTHGLIDDVKIYNYALTAKQIQTEYNQGASIRFGPSTGTP